MSPDPPPNHQRTTAAGAAGTAAATAAAAGPAADVGEFFEELARRDSRWQMTATQRRRLSPAVAAALPAGRSPGLLADTVGANLEGVRNPYAVLAARLSPAELPGPPARPVRPPWCGHCDDRTRMLGFHSDTPAPCPHCRANRKYHTTDSNPARSASAWSVAPAGNHVTKAADTAPVVPSPSQTSVAVDS